MALMVNQILQPISPQDPTNITSIGLSRAMIAWMLDINIRASIKRREFERTRIRICLYIKHMERESGLW